MMHERDLATIQVPVDIHKDGLHSSFKIKTNNLIYCNQSFCNDEFRFHKLYINKSLFYSAKKVDQGNVYYHMKLL